MENNKQSRTPIEGHSRNSSYALNDYAINEGTNVIRHDNEQIQAVFIPETESDQVIIETNEVNMTEGQEVNETFRERPSMLDGITGIKFPMSPKGQNSQRNYADKNLSEENEVSTGVKKAQKSDRYW